LAAHNAAQFQAVPVCAAPLFQSVHPSPEGNAFGGNRLGVANPLADHMERKILR